MSPAARRARRLAPLLLALLALAQAAAAQAPAAPAARSAWGFDRSDLTPHPSVQFGVLPNGMRYALMRNAEPAGALAVRLRIGAGAAVEGEREQGSMHLIEHLVFHGTAGIPQLALPLMLARDGLERWNDFNADTSFEETLYRLDLAKSDARARATALTLMREIAANLSFDRRIVEAAKQRVTAEIGERDSVEDRLLAAQNAFFFPGSAIAGRSVAGSEARVKRIPAGALRRLHQRHYAPGQATLIMVGDFDPAAAEAEIAARFSDWRAAGETEAAKPPRRVARERGAEARLFVERDAPTRTVIARTGPLGGADATRRRDFQFLEHLGSEMLNRRLARAAAGADAPFQAADSAIYDHFGTGRLARVEITARGGDWARALQAGQRELREALERGYSQAELDEQLGASRQALDRVATARTSRELADSIADAVGRGIVFTEPGHASATEAYLGQVRLAEVNAALREAWAGRERLIFVSHDRRVRGGEAAILNVWRAGLAGGEAHSPGR